MYWLIFFCSCAINLNPGADLDTPRRLIIILNDLNDKC